MRDEKAKVLKAIPPMEAKNLVRGQFRGYRNEKGVAPDSQVETFAALRLEIDSWRWKGVPFYIRAGKCLPVTCTEVSPGSASLPRSFLRAHVLSNYLRFRISPEMTIALGAWQFRHLGSPGEAKWWRCWPAVTPSRMRWRPTSACWATPWLATPRCSPVRIMWKRRGASSILC